MFRITEFSTAYGVTRNTIRRWCAEFAPFLSDGANPDTGNTRSFTLADGRVIATVAAMREENATYENIHAALADGERGEWPPASMGEDGGDDTQQDDTQPIETAVVVRLSAALAHTEGKLAATEAERDRLLASLAKEQETNASTLADERAARLEAEKVAATAPMLEAELQRAREESERIRAELDRARLPFWKRWGNG